ncbi:hypothetical protein QO004_003590 [Rhizobium mesoamericanum]|uniref:DUF1062 domain-containing protein n=1 Tax=Rhizobium mesoamericanum TaxID=1079800 RepID=UPI00277D4AC5|nr:DUF1062 domain-containing protein [Rhizobium mesoamericanum]MDQ0561790.1 hypothetical protein [Rhizobium mesoamericanum]
MHPILQVRWTIILRTAPEPWIACSGCGGPKPFRSSGKLRLNANGKKLDAWLIYRCTSCGKTWNRPLVERQNLRDIDPGTLEALQTNDPSFIRKAFDLQALRLKASRIDQSTGIAVMKETIATGQHALMLEIRLVVPGAASLRLDRMLASELGLSRSRLSALHEKGRLIVNPTRRDVLRKAPKDGTRICLDLTGETDANAILSAAVGTAGR